MNFTARVACKNQVRNRLKIKFVQLDFWKKFQTQFFKNQVQMDRVYSSFCSTDVQMYFDKTKFWSSTLSLTLKIGLKEVYKVVRRCWVATHLWMRSRKLKYFFLFKSRIKFLKICEFGCRCNCLKTEVCAKVCAEGLFRFGFACTALRIFLKPNVWLYIGATKGPWNPTIFNIIRWDYGSTERSSRCLMVKCLFW